MKNKLQKVLAIVIAAALFITFAGVLMMYRQPMEDASFDLSLVPKENAPDVDPNNFDSKGWSVYVQYGEAKTELTPNGFGGYTGLELGQTIYLSRVMTEVMDSPTLQLATAERMFSVWLDDDLIYTDCPELDNRIGYVTLPMNEAMREEPITISLPAGYENKTLTIAQSTPPWSETGRVMAFPTAVQLYCGYAYESELISESAATMLAAAFAFVIGMALLADFILNRNWSVLCLSLVAFGWMTSRLLDTSFFFKYFGSYGNAPESIIPLVSSAALLVYLTLRGGRCGRFLWIGTGLFLASVVAYGITMITTPILNSFLSNFLVCILPEWLAFGSMIALLIMGILFWRKESWFYRVFTPIALAGILISWLVAIFFTYKGQVLTQMQSALSGGQAGFFYHRSYPAVAAAAIITAIADAIRLWLQRRDEKNLLEQQRQLLLSSYDSMRCQHEEVMKLRHDMMSHYEALRGMTGEEKTAQYLDTLIGQNRNVRSIVHTGNQVLDIILNGKLSAAMDAGIDVQIQRSFAPEKLDMDDADLSSLVMNMMNNAIAGAKNSGIPTPHITIDIHVKEHCFAINCTNSADPSKISVPKIEQTVPKHGLGLKIMEDIAGRYHGVFSTETGKQDFKVTVIFPL